MMRALPSLIVIACAAFAGCNVVGTVGRAFDGEKSKAVYTLPKRPTAVIAEKYSNLSESAMDDEPVARYVSDELRQHDVASIIDADRIYTLRKSMPPERWHGMTIDAVGREIGAEQILYINLVNVSVSVEPGSGMMKGQGEARVRLVDATSGETIWPTDAADGWPIAIDTPMLRTSQDNVNQATVRTTVLRTLSDRIAKLFYTFETR